MLLLRRKAYTTTTTLPIDIFRFGAPSLQLPEILPSRCPVLSAPAEQ